MSAHHHQAAAFSSPLSCSLSVTSEAWSVVMQWVVSVSSLLSAPVGVFVGVLESSLAALAALSRCLVSNTCSSSHWRPAAGWRLGLHLQAWSGSPLSAVSFPHLPVCILYVCEVLSHFSILCVTCCYCETGELWLEWQWDCSHRVFFSHSEVTFCSVRPWGFISYFVDTVGVSLLLIYHWNFEG